jgi:3D-(3,5/4)-trihydroxycyclohexane-1,2-dione acylhydrolase (decyclizing)
VTERIKLTVAQAVVKFLARQYSERDGVRQRLIEGCYGIFGHGNIAGLGQALMQMEVEGEPGADGSVAARRRVRDPGQRHRPAGARVAAWP